MSESNLSMKYGARVRYFRNCVPEHTKVPVAHASMGPFAADAVLVLRITTVGTSWSKMITALGEEMAASPLPDSCRTCFQAVFCKNEYR